MKKSILKLFSCVLFFFFLLNHCLAQSATGGLPSFSQDKHAQLTPFLSRGYINANFGYINYPFTNANLNKGYSAERIKIPHFSGRIILGCGITDNLSVQYSVMRALLWPTYYFTNILGEEEKHSAWINEWGLTLKQRVRINKNFSFFCEGGVGLFSRNGFESTTGAIIKDANYATFLGGAGLHYKLNSRWDLMYSVSYSPENRLQKQPYTFMNSAGLIFHLRPVPDSVVAKNSEGKYFFPKNAVQIGGASNVFGFFANDLFSISPHFKGLPIFWRGNIQTETGFAVNYQKNVFHTEKRFSLDWGASASFWQTEKYRNRFFALSVFPVLKFWFLRQKPLDMYFVYSIVGPSYISRIELDGRNTGKHFTYQDFLGIGSYFGKKRKLNAELKIEHYSNGNLFPVNPGVDVPLMLNFGYAF